MGGSSAPFGEEHPLAVALAAAATGRFPAPDGAIELLPPDAAGTEAIVEFTGHAMVLSGWAGAAGVIAGRDGFGGASDVAVVAELIGVDGRAGSHDMVLVRRAGRDGVDPLAETERFDGHPRVERARRHRRNVRVFGDDRGVVTIGRGLVGRTEVSVELTGSAGGGPSDGVGRRLVLGALGHLDPEELVFAQVAPGNAASVRAFLGIGFVPIGSEILLDRRR